MNMNPKCNRYYLEITKTQLMFFELINEWNIWVFSIKPMIFSYLSYP
jgi:hypothetical protein